MKNITNFSFETKYSKKGDECNLKKGILLSLLMGILMVFGLASQGLASVDLNAAHTTIYIDNPTFDCSSCHRSIINLEHTTRVDLKTGKYYTCDTCHNPVDSAKVKASDVNAAILLKDTRCSACHTVHGPIDDVHATDPNCASCHKATLNAEHFKTITNKSFNCNICHNNTNPVIMNAIEMKNTNCAACHTVHGTGDHTSSYVLNQEVDCAQCHSNQLNQEHTSRIDQATGKNYTCDVCHKSSNPIVTNAIATKQKNCDVCHTSRHANVTHTSIYVANPTMDCTQCHVNTLTGLHVGNTTKAGVTMDCNTCHKNARTDVQSAISTNNTNCDACHVIHANITAAHTTTYVANPESDCSQCHKNVISDEHTSRNGTNGQPMTCDTCHKSTATAVVNAINAKNTNCDACHTTRHSNVNHGNGTAFMVNPPSNCADCHNRVLDTEHVGNVTKTGVTLTCASCHQSTVAAVQNAIATKNSQCTACHSTAGTHPNANHGTTTFTTDTTTQNCAKCHNTDVSVEHSSTSDKVNSAGAKMTCNTCHQSTNTVVKNAINTSNTACTVCHTTGGVTVPHSGVADPHKKTYFRETTSRCMNCHVATGIGYALTTTTNIAYHKVKEGTAYYPSGISITSTSTQTDSGSFVSPYTRTSDLTCKGCHDTSNGTATGTTYGKLLIGEYSTNTGKSGLTTSSHLCFKCHNYSVYTSTGSGSGFTAHVRSDHIVGCMACHNIKPHSQSGGRHFIAIKGQVGASTNNMVTAYTHSTSFYSKSNCSTSCANNNNH